MRHSDSSLPMLTAPAMFPPGADHLKHPLQQGIVHRGGEVEGQSVGGAGFGRNQLPPGGIGRMSLGWTAPIGFAKPINHAYSPSVQPVAIDYQSVPLAFRDRRSQGFVRSEAALDPAGIEGHSEAAKAGIPELFAGEKDARQGFTFFVQNMDARSCFAAAHGHGEQDIKAELIAGQDVRGGKDLFNAGGGNGVARRAVEDFLNRCGAARLAEDGAIFHAGREREAGVKDQGSFFDGVAAGQSRKIATYPRCRRYRSRKRTTILWRVRCVADPIRRRGRH